ncbi:hypothetical protein E8E12_008063 [Didymella heteroderae]|uniref:Uncharacterized protein n=1 Tax=Didymella heteroderae TaxID=1769908 RepID=A0A9P4WZH5_9PLEO|nr:hypothetical protein E8E12_008063 [Didymella heteroderae]
MAAGMFMPEALACPGWEYAGKLYKELKSRDTLSFEAWKLFLEAFPDQSELSHNFRLEIHEVITCWPSIVKSISTLDTNALTNFCANGLTLDLAKLISLTAIPTLTALIHTNPSQRRTHPLTGNAIRDWCRAVREKNAFPNLKLLYLCSIPDHGSPDITVLGHLSNFPALALVGIERAGSHSSIKASGTCGQWQRTTANREHKLNKTMRDTQKTIAEKTKALYTYACRVRESQTADTSGASEVEQPVLTLSCYAPRSTRDASTATWFIRRHLAPGEPQKRALIVLDHQNDGARGTKKHKIRQAKQCDVGILLDSFGNPPASDLKDYYALQS